MTESLRGPDLSGLKIDDRARRGPTGRRWVLLSAGLVALLLVAGGLYAFLREAVAEVEVATVRADKGGRPTLLNASGYVTPRQRATIAAKITARVNEIFVDEGMSVEPGQVLAKLDDSDARARLHSAQAERDATAATLATCASTSTTPSARRSVSTNCGSGGWSPSRRAIKRAWRSIA